MTGHTPGMTLDEANAYYAKHANPDSAFNAEFVEMAPGRAVLRLDVKGAHLRPGGMVSGPTQMTLADATGFMTVAATMGLIEMAVTANLTITFLRPCRAERIFGEGRILKAGRKQAVVDVILKTEDDDRPVSHAVMTFALPLEN